MIRTVIENILLFLLPTLLYAAWVLFQRFRNEAADGGSNDKNAVVTILDDAPFIWLFVTGAALVILTLSIFGSSSGGRPGQHYQPSVFQDGKIQPSHID